MSEQATVATSCLIREQFLAPRALRVERVELPERQGFCYVRELSGEERDEFENSIVADAKGRRNLANLRARLAVRTVCLDNGKLVFEPRDVGQVGKMDAATLDRIYEASAKLSRISKADQDELLGESSGPTGGSSSSGSPSSSGSSPPSSSAKPAAKS